MLNWATFVPLTNKLHQLTGRVDHKTEREECQINQPLPPALLPWQHHSNWTPENGNNGDFTTVYSLKVPQ